MELLSGISDHAPKVSVIVAVYKAEAYLNRCVDSLLAQTFKDFEILLIDDGSPDRSGAMCDEYARKDPRVRVIHKENGGVSSARQCGLDNARGEYVIHADPDDWVEPEMLEEMYRKAKEEDADMVICDFFVDQGNESQYVCQKFPPLRSDEMIDIFFLRGGILGSCWNKLVRRSCFARYAISFPPELILNEDVYVNICLFSKNIGLTYLSKAYYHYVRDVNPNSLVNEYRLPKKYLIENRKFLRMLERFLSKESFIKIAGFVRKSIIQSLLKLGGDYLKDPIFSDPQVYKELCELPDTTLKWKLIFLLTFRGSPYVVHYLFRIRRFLI